MRPSLPSDRIDTSLVLSTFKEVMKARGLSYKELSVRVGMSESGLKKLFSSRDCSFNRLTQLAAALEISLSEVLVAMRNETQREMHFTPAQQEYFLSHMPVFRFYWKLVIERHSVLELQRRFSLTATELIRYLRALDELKLLELRPGNRVKLPRLELVKWMGGGPLLAHIRKAWSRELVEQVIDGGIQKGQHFSLRAYQLTPESAQELAQALKEIDLEFGRRSVREMILNKGQVRFVKTLAVMAEGSFVESIEERGLPSATATTLRVGASAAQEPRLPRPQATPRL